MKFKQEQQQIVGRWEQIVLIEPKSRLKTKENLSERPKIGPFCEVSLILEKSKTFLSLSVSETKLD